MSASAYISRKSRDGLRSLEAKLDRSGYFGQLCLFYLLSYLALVVFIPVAALLPQSDARPNVSSMDKVILALTIVPVIETLVFQKIVYALFIRINFFQRSRALIIFISALLFGVSHFFSLSYVLMATMTGVVLMYMYIYYLPNYNKAFWSTAIIHFAHNMTTLLLVTYVL